MAEQHETGHEQLKGALTNWGHADLVAEIHTSFDLDTPESKRMLFSALNAIADNFGTYVNAQIAIVGFVMKPYKGTDPNTGEELNTVITSLITSEGKVITTHSSGIVQCLQWATQLLGMPSPKQPYRCKPTIRTGKRRDGTPWQMFWLEIEAPKAKPESNK